MNYIGLDVSLSSTGVSIWNKDGYKFLSYIKNHKDTKWTRLMSDFLTPKSMTYGVTEEYLTNEYHKMCDYEKNSLLIVNDIKEYLVDGDVFVAFEGYAYGAVGNSLLDLVTFTTLLRCNIKNIFNTSFEIFSPSTVKKETCKLVYGYTEKGKKNITIETKNKLGISGGNFTKREMMQALFDYPCDSVLSKFVKENYDLIYTLKTIPTPIPDVIDSYWILKVLMNKHI